MMVALIEAPLYGLDAYGSGLHFYQGCTREISLPLHIVDLALRDLDGCEKDARNRTVVENIHFL
jgi:hypothetical protein